MECSVTGCNKSVHAKSFCQPHYRQEQRKERGLQKPGPKPDPSKPYSRYNPETSRHWAGTHCIKGHELTEDNVKRTSNGSRICLTCEAARTPAHCPQGHEYTEENTYIAKDNSKHCRTCSRERQPEIRLMSKYRLTSDLLEQKLLFQDNKCTVCGRKFTADLKHNIDHDHSCCPGEKTCGKCIRGILCVDCNRLLGDARDSIDVLQSAINYLQNYNNGQEIRGTIL